MIITKTDEAIKIEVEPLDYNILAYALKLYVKEQKQEPNGDPLTPHMEEMLNQMKDFYRKEII